MLVRVMECNCDNILKIFGIFSVSFKMGYALGGDRYRTESDLVGVAS
jgi:hypothetical protein